MIPNNDIESGKSDAFNCLQRLTNLKQSNKNQDCILEDLFNFIGKGKVICRRYKPKLREICKVFKN